MPDTTTQMVEVDVRYDVGSREDPPGKAGLAHLVEHLMFQQRPDGPPRRR
jgi:zinc protease